MTTRNYPVQSDAGQRDQSKTFKLVKALGDNNRALVLTYLFGNKEPVLDYGYIASSLGLPVEEVSRIMDKELTRGTVVNREGFILNPRHSLISTIQDLEKRILDKSTTPYEREYWSKYEGYTFEIRREEEVDPGTGQVRPFNPQEDDTEVILKTKEGKEHVASFLTRTAFDHIFEKNKETGECATGTYFCMPDNMVIVNAVTEDNVRRTIDDLIANLEIHNYFHPSQD